MIIIYYPVSTEMTLNAISITFLLKIGKGT